MRSSAKLARHLAIRHNLRSSTSRIARDEKGRKIAADLAAMGTPQSAILQERASGNSQTV